jgi:protein-tyrosine phosphatase
VLINRTTLSPFSRSPAMSSPSPVLLRLNMVCTGNICRSPLADAIMAAKVQRAGLGDAVQVTSSGTHAHSGWRADPRSCKVGEARGYNLDSQVARDLTGADFEECTLLLALDDSHRRYMLRAARTPAQKEKVRLLMEFAGYSRAGAVGAKGGAGASAAVAQDAELDVPDPYYGELEDFELVARMVERATDGLLEAVQHALSAPDPAAALLRAVPPRASLK